MNILAASSNATLDADTGADTGSSPFSLLNVVGLFLTLSLTLLTQPIGSLLYTFKQAHGGGRASHAARYLSFFWRLNPLAGLVEASMICCVLLITAVQICRGSARRGPGIQGWQWQRRLQLTAAALLLLRAKKRAEDGRLVSQVLLDNWHASMTMQPPEFEVPVQDDGKADESTQTLASTTVTAVTTAAIDISAATSTGPLTNMPALGVVRRRTADLADEDSCVSQSRLTIDGREEPYLQGGADGPAAPPAALRPPMRQSTSMLEHGVTATSSDPRTPLESLDKLSLLKAALGSNAISHSEIVVDAFTFLSVIFVIIKLASTVLPWHIRITAACMISSWVTVQTLVALLHSHELSELDMEATVERAREVRLTLEGPGDGIPVFMTPIFLLVPLPVFGYFSLVLVTQFGELPLWIVIPSSIVCGLCVVAFFVYFNEPNALIIAFVLFTLSRQSTTVSYVLGWLIVTLTLYFLFFSPAGDNDDVGPVVNAVVLAMNYCTTAMLFAAMLRGYDAADTYKPAWLDVLG
jgi:hypothetical protein